MGSQDGVLDGILDAIVNINSQLSPSEWLGAALQWSRFNHHRGG